MHENWHKVIYIESFIGVVFIYLFLVGIELNASLFSCLCAVHVMSVFV